MPSTRAQTLLTTCVTRAQFGFRRRRVLPCDATRVCPTVPLSSQGRPHTGRASGAVLPAASGPAQQMRPVFPLGPIYRADLVRIMFCAVCIVLQRMMKTMVSFAPHTTRQGQHRTKKHHTIMMS